MGVLVGRGSTLALVQSALEDARSGHGGLVVVTGEAGIGKSRLVEAAEDAARELGLDVGHGRAVDDPGCPPLWPWTRLARDRPALAAALAEAPVGSEPGAAARFRWCAGAADALVAQARPAGLLVVLEDLHWADRTSLLLLRHLEPELPRSRLLVLATCRDAGGRQVEELLPGLLGSGTTHLRLTGLTRDDVARWLAADPSPAATAGLADALHARTGGNPLLLRLLLDALAGSDPGSAADLGRLLVDRPDLRSLVAARVRALAPEARAVVQAAAVTDPLLGEPLLAAVTGQSDEAVARALVEAEQAGVLRDGAGPDGREFAHALVRDAVLADLGDAALSGLHHRAALALERSPTPVPASVVAAHWARTTAEGAVGRRATWEAAAARAALAGHAFDEAAEAAERAVAAARADDGGGRQHLGEALLLRARCRFAAAWVDRDLLAGLEEVLDVAERTDDPALAAGAALVVHGIGTPEVCTAVRRLAERALDLGAGAPELPDRWPVLRARLLAQVAVGAAEEEVGPPAADLAAVALAEAEATHDPEAELEALAARHLSITVPDRVEERIRLGRRAVALGVASDQPLAELWGHLWLVDAAFQLGRLGPLAAELAEIERIADRQRFPVARWHHQRLCATRAALVGDFAAARAFNQEAAGVAQRMGDHAAEGLHFAFEAELAALRGDPGELSLPAEEVMARAPDLRLVTASIAQTLLVAGERERAVALLAPLRDLPRTLPVGPRWAPTMATLGICAVRLDDAALAAEVYRVLRPLASYYAADGSGVLWCSGAVAREVGDLALTAGHPAEAVEHQRAGLALNLRIGARPYVALSRAGLAAALLAADGGPPARQEAAGLLRTAAAELAALDMPGPAVAVARALARLDAAGPLSAREEEVARWVAEGLTNRAVAARLHLSERTVESHVRNVLTKLGLHNRTQLAAWRSARDASRPTVG